MQSDPRKKPQRSQTAFEALARHLRPRRWRTRRNSRRACKAAAALCAYGKQAVPVLCTALQDRNGAVRVAVVDALRQVGDERAIQPLVSTLRTCFWGGAAGRHLYLRPILTVLGLLILGISCLLPVQGKVCSFLGLAPLLPFILVYWSEHQTDKRRLSLAITRALGEIAARNPTPELQTAVPDLKALAADVVLQTAGARRTMRRTLEQIDAATADVRSLPVTASEGAPPDSLPRPASPVRPESSTLPRPLE